MLHRLRPAHTQPHAPFLEAQVREGCAQPSLASPTEASVALKWPPHPRSPTPATRTTSQPVAAAPPSWLQCCVLSQTTTFLPPLPMHTGGALGLAPLALRALGPKEGHVKGLTALRPRSRRALGNHPVPSNSLI